MKFQSDLYLPRLIGLRCDLAEGRVADAGVGGRELNAVQNIERFQPDFQPGTLAEV